MLDFVQGEYDVLIATAIVESGLDIPRANTIIIDRADLFGLAQLYQLRGRVGRASERAYCYLLVPPPSQMSDECAGAHRGARAPHRARLRLSGGGARHGARAGRATSSAREQSGYAASVGFELFCHMLEEATHELRGEPVVARGRPRAQLRRRSAARPKSYVADVGVRLSLYKRLASARATRPRSTSSRTSSTIASAQPPLEARRFVELMRLKVELRRLRRARVRGHRQECDLASARGYAARSAENWRLLAQKKSPYKITPDGRLTRRAIDGEARGRWPRAREQDAERAFELLEGLIASLLTPSEEARDEPHDSGRLSLSALSLKVCGKSEEASGSASANASAEAKATAAATGTGAATAKAAAAAPRIGGSVVAVGDFSVEVAAHQSGLVEALVLDARARP